MCINHTDKIAVTKCISCHKPLCEQCRIQTEFGVVCSPDCGEKMRQFNERHPGGKISGKAPNFIWHKIRWWVNLIVVLFVVYIILYIQFGTADVLEQMKLLFKMLRKIIMNE